MDLHTKVSELHRVGKTLEKRLKHLGIVSVRDLLFYFPFRYEDYSRVTPMKDLRDGMQTTVMGKVELIANKRSPRKRTMITEAVVADATDRIRVVWFGQPFIAKILRVGDTVYLSGIVKEDMFGVQMVSPSYERYKIQETRNKEDKKGTTHTARIVPMYSLTSGITQKQLRFLVSQVIGCTKEIDEWLPEEILDKADLITLPFALKAIHFPEMQEELKQAERRIKFGELFILQLRAEMIRQSVKQSVAPQIAFKEQETKAFVQSLPFTLTNDQRKAAWEILKDLEKGEPMNRMLLGDVGSGKTVVAALVAYNAVLNGLQVAIMAPTEILANQHYDSFCTLFPDSIVTALLSRSQFSIFNFQFSSKDAKGQKGELADAVVHGEAQILIGTHALLQEGITFKDLGLVVVDEQHRFGVEQRKIIREKSGNTNTTPHFLSMSATPIPRSLALTLYGDLDLSVIREMPKGRKPVITRVVDPHNREKAYAFIREEVKKGRQVFVICPLIEEIKKETRNKIQDTNNLQFSNFQFSNVSEKKSVLAEYEKLSKNVFPDLKIGYLHGRMPAKEKDETMKQFNKATIDIFVSTSVVEVGVDIPNASVMMIEGADRFGLAQLHQFRGRVGRSEHQSYCFLFTESDSESVKQRLDYFQKHTSGFDVAEYDLHSRGPGEVYGTAQSGMMNLRLATLKDTDLMKLARQMARGIDFGKFPILREKVKEWEEEVHLE